jgi:hypothetical protein
MGGKYINKIQAKLYMHYRKSDNLSQVAAAAKVGISTRSGRTIEKKLHHTCKPQQPRNYKTRSSPIDEIWNNELEPMLQQFPDLQPKTLFIYLQRTYLDQAGLPIYSESILRTLQRYVAKWQAINGKSKAIMFPQEHIPGQQGLSDFTEFNNFLVTIKGKPFKHKFYHFRLVYSKWSYLKVIQSGESMQALSEGLQEALYALGGVPHEHRTDSLSAAFKNLSKEAKDDLTTQYQALCSYYNMTPSRNNKGQKHENGSVESSHGHIKNRMKQEIILRGSHDFSSIEEYKAWVHSIVKSSNERNTRDFETEKLALQPLPKYKTVDYEVKSVSVSNLSLVRIKGLQYSIPNRLSGHTLTLHIYQLDIKMYLGSTFVYSCMRKYQDPKIQPYVINYQHVISALIKKPAAFRYCKYRDEIFPNDEYRKIWEYLERTEPKKIAPKSMLRLLKLAADYDCEAELSQLVMQLIESGQPIKIAAIESQFNLSNPELPNTECKQHELAQYDFIINQTEGESHATL